jgi:lipopolysaccharide export system protein LptA
MTSRTLIAFYDSATPPAPNTKAKPAPIKSATPGPGRSPSIRRPKGRVAVTQEDQVVTGETAVFDTRANLITMLGVSRVESDSGKVQGLFIQGQGCGPAAPGSGAPLPSSSAPNKPK